MRHAGLMLAMFTSLAVASPALADSVDGAAPLLGHWLSVQEEEPTAWGQAWLQVEASQSRVLDQSFYARLTPAEKAAVIQQALETEMGAFPARMKGLSELQGQWAVDVAMVQQAMAKDLGALAPVDVYLFYAMSPQKAVATSIDGKPSVVVNARLLLPYQADAARLLLTRALLVHAQAGWAKQRQETALPQTVAGQLQTEGVSAWVAGRVIPATGVAGLLSVTPEQAALLDKARGAIARELMGALDSAAPAQLDRFFGAKAPEGWPPATGRYLGLIVAREIASELGGPAIVRLSRKAYTERARAILKRLATGSLS